MIYIVAVLLSVITFLQSVASAITGSNIRHLKNGRAPNAGTAIFPMIPILPPLFVGVAWLLHVFFVHYAIWILVLLFLALSVLWAVGFIKLRAEFRRALAGVECKARI